MSADEGRPARVTIEGTTKSDPSAQFLVINTGHEVHEFHLTDPAVQVEYLTPPRVWTDWDVVAGAFGGRVHYRRDGYWWAGGSRTLLFDDEMTSYVDRRNNPWRVLRYQHDE